MSWADKTKKGIEDWFNKPPPEAPTQPAWKDRLRGWMMSWVMGGVIDFLERDEPAAIDNVRDMITKIKTNPNTPQELKDMLERIEGGGSWFMIVIVVIMAVQMAIQTISTLWVPTGKQMSHGEERIAQTHRLDPLSVITAWRRDKPAYEKYFDDLRDQGWSDDRIDALKFLTLFYPSPRDLVGFLAHEVYEDDMAARYGLDADFGEVAKHLDKFEKAGMALTQVKEFWRDHWEHASYLQVIEMLHRGLLTETGQPPPTTQGGWDARDAEGTKILRDWYKLVEIADFWRDKLTAMSWNVPTRVDVRRWWDMRTISEEELRNIYHRQGYHGTDLDNYVLWTKVYVAFPDIIARVQKGWIKPEEGKAELARTGLEEPRLTELWQTKFKKGETEPVAEAKKVTQTAIIKWVKEDPEARWEQGIDLLMDLGYDESGARFVLSAYIAELGSPETYEDWKQVTGEYKIATGREAKPMPEELRKAAAEVVKLNSEVESLQRAIEEEEAKLIPDEVLPEAATERLTELQVSLHRAQAELARVQTDYKVKLAEWRHG